MEFQAWASVSVRKGISYNGEKTLVGIELSGVTKNLVRSRGTNGVGVCERVCDSRNAWYSLDGWNWTNYAD